MKETLLKKKKIIVISTIVVAIVAIAGVIILKNTIPDTLLKKTTYDLHTMTKKVIKINEDGKVYKSEIVDELLLDGTAPKDEFHYTENVSNTDLENIKRIINHMKTEEMNNNSENYGIVVNLGEGTLYGSEYFNQEEVDRLNTIIKKYE